MDRRGELNLGTIIVLFMGIVFLFALLTPIFNTQAELTTKQTTDNQSVSVASAFVDGSTVNESVNFTIYSQDDWKKIDCPLSSVELRNGAGTTLTADTDYVLYANDGVFSLKDTANTAPDTSLNLTYVDYTYCPDGYNKDSSSRSVATLIGLFAAVGVLAFVLDRSGVLDLGFKS